MEWFVYFAVSGMILLFIVIPSICICKCRNTRTNYHTIEYSKETEIVSV